MSRFWTIPAVLGMAVLGPGTGTAGAAETGPAAGERCAEAPARAETRERLFGDLARAPDPAAGQAAEEAIWQFWSSAPDARAQALLDTVHERRRWHDLAAAEQAAQALTNYCPDYPEGWNQLATVLFLRDRPKESLEAVARTLALEPNHFGALAGKALILMRQGRVAPAQAALRRAVEIHPWLRERDLLLPEAGQDH